MKILITGANGFMGKNLYHALLNISKGLDKRFPSLSIDEIMRADIETSDNELLDYIRRADFIFHLAGVNRPVHTEEFITGNVGSLEFLTKALTNCGNRCPVMLSSSAQASLSGRFEGSEYGKSKLEAENLLFEYGKLNNSPILIYRFPNAFGEWSKPNYTSAVATFYHNISRELPISVTDPAIELELVYIDDVVNELIGALQGLEHRCNIDRLTLIPDKDGKYCHVPKTFKVTLGEIVDSLMEFRNQPADLYIPTLKEGSFKKALYSTYVASLPAGKISYSPEKKTDLRGSFTELVKSLDSGQMSVNVSAPGVTKGEHWHQSKIELFIVVSGHALIQQRKIGTTEIIEKEVSGNNPECVFTLPGYTHNLINLSDSENLITLIWCNEPFDPANPDTFYEKVNINDQLQTDRHTFHK